MNEKDLNVWVLTIRGACGMSQEEFAEAVGISRNTLNAIERGRYKISRVQCNAIMNFANIKLAEGHPAITALFNAGMLKN